MQNIDQQPESQMLPSDGFSTFEMRGALVNLLNIFLEQARNSGAPLKALQNAALLPNIHLPQSQPPAPAAHAYINGFQSQLDDQSSKFTKLTCNAPIYVNGSMQVVSASFYLPEPAKLDKTTGDHWYEAFDGIFIIRSKNLEFAEDQQNIYLADEKLETSQYIPMFLPNLIKLSQDQFAAFQIFIEQHGNKIVMANLTGIADTADIIKLLNILQKNCGNLLRITIDHKSWTPENFSAISEILEKFSSVINIIAPKCGKGRIPGKAGLERNKERLEEIAKNHEQIIFDALTNQGHSIGPFKIPYAQMVIELLNLIANAKPGYTVTKNIINRDILRKKILQVINNDHCHLNLSSFNLLQNTLSFAKQRLHDFDLSEIANLLFDPTHGVINELRKSFFFATYLFINSSKSPKDLKNCIDDGFKYSPTIKTTFGVVYISDNRQFHFCVRNVDGTTKQTPLTPEMLKQHPKLKLLLTHLESILASDFSSFSNLITPVKYFCRFTPSSSSITMDRFTRDECCNLIYIIAEILDSKLITNLNLQIFYLLESLLLFSLNSESIQKLEMSTISSIPQTHQIPELELLKLAHVKNSIDLKPHLQLVLLTIDKSLHKCVKMSTNLTLDENLSIAHLAMSLLQDISSASNSEDRDSVIRIISNFFYLSIYFYQKLFDENRHENTKKIQFFQAIANTMIECKLFEEVVNFLPIDTLHNIHNLFSIFYYFSPLAEIAKPHALTQVNHLLTKLDPNSFSYEIFLTLLNETRNYLTTGDTETYIAKCKSIISIRSQFEQDKNLFTAVVELIFSARTNFKCLPVLVDFFKFAPTEYEKIRLLSEDFLTMKLQGTFDTNSPGMLDIFKNWLHYVLTNIKETKPSLREKIEVTCINLNKIIIDEQLLALSVKYIAETSTASGINKRDHLIELAKIHIERNKLIEAVNFYEKALDIEARKKPRQQSRSCVSHPTKKPSLFQEIPHDAKLEIQRDLFSLYIKLGDKSVAENNLDKAEEYYKRGTEQALFINEEVFTTRYIEAYKTLAEKYMSLGLREKAAQCEQIINIYPHKRTHETDTAVEGEPSSKRRKT